MASGLISALFQSQGQGEGALAAAATLAAAADGAYTIRVYVPGKLGKPKLHGSVDVDGVFTTEEALQAILQTAELPHTPGRTYFVTPYDRSKRGASRRTPLNVVLRLLLQQGVQQLQAKWPDYGFVVVDSDDDDDDAELGGQRDGARDIVRLLLEAGAGASASAEVISSMTQGSAGAPTGAGAGVKKIELPRGWVTTQLPVYIRSKEGPDGKPVFYTTSEGGFWKPGAQIIFGKALLDLEGRRQAAMAAGHKVCMPTESTLPQKIAAAIRSFNADKKRQDITEAMERWDKVMKPHMEAGTVPPDAEAAFNVAIGGTYYDARQQLLQPSTPAAPAAAVAAAAAARANRVAPGPPPAGSGAAAAAAAAAAPAAAAARRRQRQAEESDAADDEGARRGGPSPGGVQRGAAAGAGTIAGADRVPRTSGLQARAQPKKKAKK